MTPDDLLDRIDAQGLRAGRRALCRCPEVDAEHQAHDGAPDMHLVQFALRRQETSRKGLHPDRSTQRPTMSPFRSLDDQFGVRRAPNEHHAYRDTSRHHSTRMHLPPQPLPWSPRNCCSGGVEIPPMTGVSQR